MKRVIYTSTTKDGSMKSNDGDQPAPRGARIAFLQKNSIEPAATTLLRLTYDGDNYCRYGSLTEQNRGDGILTDSTIGYDALVTTTPGQAILLPLADCIGAVFHDTRQNILMVSHLGRHNLEQNGGTESITYMIQQHKSHAQDITVWLSPAAGVASYPLYAFDHRSLHDVATEQIMTAGILSEHIEISPIDSATDPNYFSHSQFLAGNQTADGRFAIVAMLQNKAIS